MMKILLALIFPAVFPLTTDDWETVKLADDIFIKMPANAQRTNFAVTAWKVQYAFEDSTKIGAMVNDHANTGVSEQTVVDVSESLKKIRESNKTRLLAKGEKIISMTEGSYKDKTFVDLSASFTKNGQEFFHYSRLLLAKTFTVEMFYYSGTKGNDEQLKDKFFNSLEFR